MIKSFHPVTLFMYFFYVIFTAIVTLSPLTLIPSFVGAVLFLCVIKGLNAVKSLFLYLIMIALITITNPLFSHNGATILFFINDSRITLEAFIYGAAAALMIVGMLIWFNCFNKIFDSERLMYLIGRPFPKLALVFSMTLNYVPRLIRDFRNINNALKSVRQTRLKRYLGSFSAVITRSMEGAITTSDSMSARGYGLKGRTFFHRFRFTVFDGVWMFVFTVLFAVGILCRCEISYYPYFEIKLTAFGCAGAVSYSVLAFLPFVIEVKETLKWKLFLSKI